MHCHANAALTPKRRAKVFEAVEAGMTVTAACLAFRVSRRFYYRWLPRWRAQRRDGLCDASSRPRASPQRLSLARGGDRSARCGGAPAGVPTGSGPGSGCRPRRATGSCVARVSWGTPRSPCPSCATSTSIRVTSSTSTPRSSGTSWAARGTAPRAIARGGAGASAGRSSTWPSTTPAAWSTRSSWPTRRARRPPPSPSGPGPGSRARASAVRRILIGQRQPLRQPCLRRCPRGTSASSTRAPDPTGRARMARPSAGSGPCCRSASTSRSSPRSAQRRLALARFIDPYNEVRPHLGIGGRTPRQRLSEKLAA